MRSVGVVERLGWVRLAVGTRGGSWVGQAGSSSANPEICGIFDFWRDFTILQVIILLPG